MPGLVAGALGAGVHDAFSDAVNALGHDFAMLTTEGRGPALRGRMVGEVLRSAPLWHRLDSLGAPLLRTRSVLSPAAALARYLTSANDIDLLHMEVAYPFGAAAMLAATAARWRGPIAVTPMGEDTLTLDECLYGFRRYLVPRLLVDSVLRRAACIRCISPLHERLLVPLAPRTPRRVIPLNVSAGIVAASKESDEVRAARRRQARVSLEAELGIPGRRIVLSLGRLHPFKGIDILIRAMSQVPDAILVIAGPSLRIRATGDEASRLARLVHDLALDERVRFLGPVTGARAMELLAAADVVCVPSRLESLNKVCVEAIAVGTTFVVTETTGISAWARTANLGVVVPPCDESALAAGLIAALSHPQPPAAADIQRFVDQFSPATVAAAVLEFYEDVLGKR